MLFFFSPCVLFMKMGCQRNIIAQFAKLSTIFSLHYEYWRYYAKSLYGDNSVLEEKETKNKRVWHFNLDILNS